MSVSRGVETIGPVEVLIRPTFWKNWLEICRTGAVVHCSPLCHYTRGKGLSRLQLCKACEKIITKEYWKGERTAATASTQVAVQFFTFGVRSFAFRVLEQAFLEGTSCLEVL